MGNKVNWGIIGLGKIANKFASDLLLSENAILHGVASQDSDKAKAFSIKYNSHTYYDSYEALAKDPAVDIIYIATPHTFHFENTMLCLKYGKAVLCEKPLGMNAHEVKIMLKEAASKKLYLMEAMWTRFIPATEKVIQLLNENAIGEIASVSADFGFKGDTNPATRIYNKQLGAGSLLDIGIYPIYLSLLVLGLPSEIKASARMTSTEVDSCCSMQFDYNNAAKAHLESTIEEDTPTEATIIGTKGTIKLHSRFHHSEKITLYQNGVMTEEFEMKNEGNGYIYEIEEVNNCLQNDQAENKKHPHSMSLDLISLIDKVRAKIGLTYD